MRESVFYLFCVFFYFLKLRFVKGWVYFYYVVKFLISIFEGFFLRRAWLSGWEFVGVGGFGLLFLVERWVVVVGGGWGGLF